MAILRFISKKLLSALEGDAHIALQNLCASTDNIWLGSSMAAVAQGARHSELLDKRGSGVRGSLPRGLTGHHTKLVASFFMRLPRDGSCATILTHFTLAVVI